MTSLTHHVMLSEERRLILFLTPKCGNSSIKDLILKACGTPGLGYEYDAGFRFINPEDMTEEYRSYNTIVIGRNPIDRIISCWRDKIMGAQKGKPITDWGNDFYGQMPFAEFVRACKLVYDLHGSEALNMHARPITQELNLYDCEIAYFMKLEDILEDTPGFKRFLSRFGLAADSSLGHVNKSVNHEAQFDVDTMATIMYLYEDDFELFEYPLL